MKKLFFLPALAALFFASCSSDEPGGPASPEEQVGERYMAVTIRTAGMGGSKALPVDVEFVPAEGNEATLTADNIRFYFFTADGRPFTLVSEKVNGTVEKTNMVKLATGTTLELSKDAFGSETTANGVLILGKPDVPYVGLTPSKVLCIANPKDAVVLPDGETDRFKVFANKTLDQIRAIMANRPSNMESFTMTSATYVDNNNEVFTADCSENAMPTMEEAKSKPVQIFMERLVAKVRVSGLSKKLVLASADDKDKDGKEFSIITSVTSDGAETRETVKFNAELVGWQLFKKPSTSLVIKNVKSVIATPPFDDWNDAARHRCYWSVASPTSFVNTSYDLYETAATPQYFTLGNKDDATNNKDYLYENTGVQKNGENDLKVTDRGTDASAIVVKAVIKKGNDTDGYDFCMWAGQLYSSAALKQLVYNTYKITHNNTPYTAEDVNFTTEGSTPNTYKAKVGTEVTAFDNISYWKNGVTSYWLNIEHMGGKFGVVRNHIYDYTIDKVIGLGVPGNNPENPEPDTESYLAARVNVLNWHVVSKTVNLE